MQSLNSMARVLLTLSFIVLAACSDDNDNPPSPEVPTDNSPGTIVDVAAESGDFTTLVEALQATGLDVTLADENASFTVFAPTDDAFAALGQDTIDALLGDTDTLSDILLYHVLSGDVVDAEAAQSLAGSTVETANGDAIAITIRDGELFINNAQVVSADIQASNGIIHVIDAVLIPAEDAEPTGNIVEVAMAAGDFTTLLAAAQAAGLDDDLADEGATYTVFAPTDDAFAALGQDAINALLADPDALTDVLLYHVIADSAVDSIQATALIGQEVMMANGDNVLISIREGNLFVNESRIVVTDVPATNGLIHVVDAVLLPPEDEAVPGTIVDVAVAAGSFTTLVAALEATGLDETLSDPAAQFTVFAPSDEAFDKLGQETVDSLLADPETLADILLYHVIADQAVDAETALTLDGSDVEMANGGTVSIRVTDGELFLNDSRVIDADIEASNGIIHVIDTVLSP